MKYLKYSILLFVILAISSCHKDEEQTTLGEVTTSTPVTNIAVSGDVLGYVYDEDNNPVANASVSLLSETTMTDQYGVFKFKNVELDAEGTYVRVSKSGYIHGSDMIAAIENTKHTSRIKLLKLDINGTFSASAGGSINVEGGGQILFSPESIVTDDGNPYTGAVSVTAKRLATDDPTLGDMMPGGLIADAENGATVTLGSLGMIAVELRDGSGNELHIAPGKTAEVTFPIADFQKSDAPTEIKLWSFEENIGKWIEEGTAVRDGDQYKATVSHFSFWNCDAPFPLVNICGKVIFSDGTPASNLSILIETDLYGCGFGWTNEDGSFAGKVPKNQILTIKIYNYLCNNENSITTIEVGPFVNKTILDDIIIDLPSSYNIEGQVVCGTDPVQEATVIYKYQGVNYILESSEDGGFNINIPDDCGDPGEITVFAIDPATGNASTTATITDSGEFLTLQICNDCNLSVEIAKSFDCDTRTLNVSVSGIDNYSIEWTDGSTEEEVSLPPQFSGQFCVTVTANDNPDCTQTNCTDIEFFSQLWLEYWVENSCTEGTINLYPGGGQMPYELDILKPDGSIFEITLQDSLFSYSGLANGAYVVTLTDANNCSKTQTITVETSGTFDVSLEFSGECNESIIFVNHQNTTGNFSYEWSNGVTTNNSFLHVDSSGEYCVTITDSDGCSGEDCIAVVVDFSETPNLIHNQCDNGNYEFIETTGFNGNVIMDWPNYNFNIELFSGQPVLVDLIAVEFSLPLVWGYNSFCEFDEISVSFPRLTVANNPTEYVIINPSCEDCEDGGIDYLLDETQFISVNGAQYGSLHILDENYNDVSMQNSNQTLAAGTYYIVISDQNTGCYIYSRRVVLE